MRVAFFKYFIEFLAIILITLQSIVRAFRFFNTSSTRAYGWAAPNFVRRSYVIDIANCLNNNVDMSRRKSKTSKVDELNKAKGLKSRDAATNLELETLHREFEQLTPKYHVEQILNTSFNLKRIRSRKRSLEISYESEGPNKKLERQVGEDGFNVEEIIREMRSKSSEARKAENLKSKLSREDVDEGKVNNFRLVEEEVCKIPNFTKVWNGIANKRNKELAPVDQYGSHCLAEQGKDFEFQTVVACMLSSQTKDEVTASCMENLKKRGLTLENIVKMDVSELDSLISKVGFHSTKAKNIKKVAEILKEKYGGKVPSNKKDLESLPGIGPKMANLIQQIAFNIVDGIAVDLHVHRITNRLGWVKTKTPEETRVKLEELLPKSLWSEVNPLLVGFGQTFCTAAGPGCPTCPVNKWCPTGISNLRNRRSY
ncbi:endonuclease III [Theileria orientalis]|uniref:Endonuclease III homolog n=2 Tax=Theileria orientalis TaxID=68886 RepID=A0A976M8F8_THEOR|nr:endonuclease III [Theileria orientalis]